jgi:hypothetical protein
LWVEEEGKGKGEGGAFDPSNLYLDTAEARLLPVRV